MIMLFKRVGLATLKNHLKIVFGAVFTFFIIFIMNLKLLLYLIIFAGLKIIIKPIIYFIYNRPI